MSGFFHAKALRPPLCSRTLKSPHTCCPRGHGASHVAPCLNVYAHLNPPLPNTVSPVHPRLQEGRHRHQTTVLLPSPARPTRGPPPERPPFQRPDRRLLRWAPESQKGKTT